MKQARLWIGAATLVGCLGGGSWAGSIRGGHEFTVQVLKKDGALVEGTVETEALPFRTQAIRRRVSLNDLRSFHSADPATSQEAARISAGLSAVAGKDVKAGEAAAAELTDLGLPVLSPLLAAYQDRDGREPDPLYRLFARIVPGHADGPDRTLDLIRLGQGTTLRGKAMSMMLRVVTQGGRVETIPSSEIRRLAVRKHLVERSLELQSLRHCTYVSFLDTGIGVTPASRLSATSTGYARLSFDEDGWASDPDGIPDPLPGKRRLQEGFRWGAVLGRVGTTGQRWLAGKQVEKGDLGSGRLYFAINDNEHWQNNVGSYRMRLKVRDAYDLGDPQ